MQKYIILIIIFIVISNILLNAGTFTETNLGSLTNVQNSSIVLGDIDNDGDLDLILTGKGSNSTNARIYQNDGTGSFTEINPGSLTGVCYGSIALGDIDNDGDLDLILTGNSGSYEARIYQNDSAGNFTEMNPGNLTGVFNGSIALGDIDNDGDLDLILTGFRGIPIFISKIYANNGIGEFVEINVGSLPGVLGSSIALGDIDNDGDLDLILTGFYTDGGDHYEARIYRNDGTGSFTEIYVGFLEGTQNNSIALGDIDNDGDLDLILTGLTSSDDCSKIYTNNGTGSFAEIYANSLTNVSCSSIALGDIDNDGDLDLILTGYVGLPGTVSKIYENDGTGSFTEIYSNSLTNVRYGSIVLGDIDNDNDLDLILTGENLNAGVTVSKIYRNNESTINNSPSIPSGMEATNSEGFWKFSWDQSTDDHTSQDMLRYQIAIGVNPGVYDYASANIDYPRGQANMGKVTMVTCIRPYYQTKIPYTEIVYWKVCAVDSAFINSPYSSEQIADSSIPPPEKCELLNYPNPFNPLEGPTLIKWYLDEDSFIELVIYSFNGEIVYKWKFEKSKQGGSAGINQTSWNGKNGIGEICANGVYICCLINKSTGRRYQEKIMILK